MTKTEYNRRLQQLAEKRDKDILEANQAANKLLGDARNRYRTNVKELNDQFVAEGGKLEQR